MKKNKEIKAIKSLHKKTIQKGKIKVKKINVELELHNAKKDNKMQYRRFKAKALPLVKFVVCQTKNKKLENNLIAKIIKEYNELYKTNYVIKLNEDNNYYSIRLTNNFSLVLGVRLDDEEVNRYMRVGIEYVYYGIRKYSTYTTEENKKLVSCKLKECFLNLEDAEKTFEKYYNETRYSNKAVHKYKLEIIHLMNWVDKEVGLYDNELDFEDEVQNLLNLYNYTNSILESQSN